jgi:hypothetical protein
MNLKESIRRILKEERNVKNTLVKLIDELGIEQASKITAISITKLVQLSDVKINNVIANKILVENLNKGKLKDTYKQFKIESSINDVFYWQGELQTGHYIDKYTESITAMATPFWDGEDYTPVEIEWFTLLDRSKPNEVKMVVETEGYGSFYQTFKDKTSFDSVEELFNWYEKVYLPGVHNIIMHLLPEVHIFIDEKLDEDKRDN